MMRLRMRTGVQRAKAIKNNDQHSKNKNDGGERQKAESGTNQTCSQGEKECTFKLAKEDQ